MWCHLSFSYKQNVKQTLTKDFNAFYSNDAEVSSTLDRKADLAVVHRHIDATKRINSSGTTTAPLKQTTTALNTATTNSNKSNKPAVATKATAAAPSVAMNTSDDEDMVKFEQMASLKLSKPVDENLNKTVASKTAPASAHQLIDKASIKKENTTSSDSGIQQQMKKPKLEKEDDKPEVKTSSNLIQQTKKVRYFNFILIVTRL